jgi:prefoldin subunit 5
MTTNDQTPESLEERRQLLDAEQASLDERKQQLNEAIAAHRKVEKLIDEMTKEEPDEGGARS